ncbi:hypothetical protein SAMD00019534_067100 [Acytostelium subglobosum LB1]|uniref:hypothetical protein n=1 Tax=Acytostelium subglobosum LB1 TaxID=1410327 RepID=UPI000644D518|nr:hypothetical protein SAMD00019534_067100 [Acytostelium subglobosum LB1]GAM23535.1 hypothetical protein SAMD00019534_067100 [Acytostelium subglobosum LB1]|eukprot:XP_012753276.1 hypothetical protein SAMD00019534_067100 [Acytostelium subglobosum LB1]
MSISNIQTDLADGVLLINLLEILSSKSIGHYNKKAPLRIQKLENLNKVMQFLKNEGVKLVAISPEDIADGKIKLILGVTWTIILKYQVQPACGNDEDGMSPKSAMLQWVNDRVRQFEQNANNFTTSWNDGRLLTALIFSFNPGVIDLSSITREPVVDLERALTVASEYYDVPKIIDAADMANSRDELSVLTYVALLRSKVTTHQ